MNVVITSVDDDCWACGDLPHVLGENLARERMRLFEVISQRLSEKTFVGEPEWPIPPGGTGIAVRCSACRRRITLVQQAQDRLSIEYDLDE